MGQWGYFDDEGDYIHDVWWEIEKLFLPKSFIEIEKYISFDLFNKIKEGYMFENQDKVFEEIGKWIKNFKKTELNSNEDNYWVITGILLLCARKFNGDEINITFPKTFPRYLIEEGLKANNILIKNIDPNKQEWKNLNRRKEALKKQEKIFKDALKNSNG